MMLFRNNIIFIIVIVGLSFSCKETPNLKNFNSKTWKSDPMGCLGVRQKNIETLNDIKIDLVGISENQLLEVMGFPDKKILEERSKKQYFYYLSSTVCSSKLSENKAVVVDFDALHRVVVLSTEIERENQK